MAIMAADKSEASTLNVTDIRRKQVGRLVSHLAYQVQHGCRDVRCSTPTCFTSRLRDRRRTSRVPLRKYTQLSSLAIAFSLASSLDSQGLLCPFVLKDEIFKQELLQEAQRIDQKSLMQQLCSTEAVRSFMRTYGNPQPGSGLEKVDKKVTVITKATEKYSTDTPACVLSDQQSILLSDLDSIIGYLAARISPFKPSGCSARKDGTEEVRQYIMRIFESPSRLAASFTDVFPLHAEWSPPKVVLRIVSSLSTLSGGLFLPIHDHLRQCLGRIDVNTPSKDLFRIMVICLYDLGLMWPKARLGQEFDALWNGLPNTRPYMVDGRRPSLISLMAVIVAKSLRHGRRHKKHALERSMYDQKSPELDPLLKSLLGYLSLSDLDAPWPPKYWRVSVWIHLMEFAFQNIWDGHTAIATSSPAGCILEVIETLIEEDWRQAHDNDDSPFGGIWTELSKTWRQQGIYGMRWVWRHLDIGSACDSWLSHVPQEGVRHIFSYRFLFSDYDHWECFRTLCHGRMRKACKAASFVNYARSRIYPHLTHEYDSYLDRRLRVAQESYLVLKISRENILADALDQLWQKETRQLHKPLRVRMGSDEGEIGHDLGGVQVEFFNMLCHQLFKVEQSLFVTDEQTQLSWFKVGSLEPLYRYELLGVLFGLAVYNGITLPVSFPLVFYKKLMGFPTHVNDLEEGWDDVHKSLFQLQTYSGDVENDLALEHIYTISANGVDLGIDITRHGCDEDPNRPHDITESVRVFFVHAHKHHVPKKVKPVKENGVVQIDDEATNMSATEKPKVEDLRWPGWKFTRTVQGKGPLPVTNSNRGKYSWHYASWILDYSIRPQFYAFAAGFYQVLDLRTIRILPPEAFKKLIEGQKTIHVIDLKRLVTYEGYTATSDQIKWFWEVIEEYSQEKLGLLLEFVTGSKRLPASGQHTLRFNITRMDGETQALPQSSTCFGNLLLPTYRSKEVMKQKLDIALEHSLGFGQA